MNNQHIFLKKFYEDIYYDVFKRKIPQSKLNPLLAKNSNDNLAIEVNLINLGITLEKIDFDNINFKKKQKFVIQYGSGNFRSTELLEIKNRKTILHKANKSIIVNCDLLKAYDNICFYTFHKEKTIRDEIFLYDKMAKISNMYNIISIVSDVVLFILLTISNLILKIIMEDVIIYNDTNALVSIIVFFSLIFILQISIENALKFYKKRKSHFLSKLYYDNLLNKLMQTKYEVLNKISMEQMLSYNKTIPVIISHNLFNIQALVADIIICAFASVFLWNLPWFLNMIIIIDLIAMIIIYFMNFLFNKKTIDKRIMLDNQFSNTVYNFLNYLRIEKNYAFALEIKNNINKKIDILHNVESSFFMKLNQLDLYETIIRKIINFTFIAVFVWLIIENNNKLYTIANMLFYLNMINILSSNANSICSFIANYPEFKYNNKVFNSLDKNLVRKTVNGYILDKKINKIDFNNINVNFDNKIVFNKYNLSLNNDTIIYGKSGSGKTTLLKTLYKQQLYQNIKINNLPLSQYNIKNLEQNIIYYNASFDINEVEINSLLYGPNKDIIFNIIKKLAINLNDLDSLSSGQKQIIIYLKLLTLKNKIILLDEPLSHLDNETKTFVISSTKAKLLENNFLVWVSHDKKIIDLFKNKLEINNAQ